MALLGRRRTTARLAPELDDADLGKVRKRLVESRAAAGHALVAAMIEQLLRGSGRDWDRRAHRMNVLAQSTSPEFQSSWARDRDQDPDAQLLYAWGVMLRTPYENQPDAQVTYDALDACARATEFRPEDPNPWAVRLGLLRLWRRPSTEVFPLWGEIVRRDRWHREAHLQMLGYLSPWECGSHSQTVEFLDRVRGEAPPTAPTAGLEVAALVDRYHGTLDQGGIEGLTARHMWSSPDAATALDHALANWPRPGYLSHAAAVADLNLLAYALVHATRVTQTGEVFRAIGGLVTSYPWARDESGDPLQAYANGQQRAGV
ncbi:hypothetical protein [Streptomyces sp. MA5143a]|uniref:hypothetical protein n=1 Tax=Streptomyces sp. MA5143a TaxID=2083010 RepID=UPI000D19BB7A|nr:hypothetical protein [Streptomyces sp. MA5143a]SPF05463.1 hypothetical protein SMA5143A_6276 [Streptomyces sp. MA5143a]